MLGLWWFVMLKIIRIAKTNRLTSIADFISALWQKPVARRPGHSDRGDRGDSYIALQLKAVSSASASC